MSFLSRIAACNVHDLSGFRPFRVGTEQVGWVRPALVETLVSELGDAFQSDAGGLRLNPALDGFDRRTAAMSDAVDALVARGFLPARRGEMYAVRAAWPRPALCTLDRAAVSSFGVPAFGVHLNGYVERPDGIHMWIARRSADRLVDPGKLDTLVGGGHPHGLTVRENLIKESAEEAGIGRELALAARPAGALSYVLETGRGLKRDTHFVYDLALSPDFTPRNADGEVAGFHLWPIQEVAARVRDSEDFKYNIGPVIADFLIRHGLLGPEDEPDYLEIVRSLHR